MSMEEKTYDLCGRCAAELREAYTLVKLQGGVNQKITCAHCGKRRYGATYRLEPRKTK